MVEVAAGPSDSSTHEKVGRCFFCEKILIFFFKYSFVLFCGVNLCVFVLISFPWC